MSLPFIELQTALYQRLVNDEKVNELLYQKLIVDGKEEEFLGVYDFVDEDTPFPYVVIGEPRLAFEEIKNSDAQEVTVTLHTWYNQQQTDRDGLSKYGNTETYKILNAIYNAMKYKLIVDGWDVVRTKPSEPKVFDDIDNITKHGVITFKFTLKRK